MELRRLGRTDLWVSVIGVGTCQFRVVPRRQAHATLLRAFDLGVNLVHVAPDYEGAEEIVAEAVREFGGKVIVASQAYDVQGNERGRVHHFERLFEDECRRHGRQCLDLFGIACIDDREQLRENVWREGGMVAFLLRMKQEGRLGAIFCTTHGDPAYQRRLIESGVFDAIMVAGNALGFHLLSVRSTPHRPFEDIPTTRREILPLAAERGVGILLMKPFAGGLLLRSRALPPTHAIAPASDDGDAPAILRSLLGWPGVCSVVPGTVSPVEAEVNARAGHRATPPDVSDLAVTAHVDRLRATVCSRCGVCDDLCSQRLPVSWLFRASYIAIHPSARFETWDDVEYFRLHPGTIATCASCPAVTCHCPYGIDIPRALPAVHQQMLELITRGVTRSSERETTIGDGEFAAATLARDLPAMVAVGERARGSIWVENRGTRGWFPAHSTQRGEDVLLSVRAGGSECERVALRDTTHPAGRAHFAFELCLPCAGRQYVELWLLSEHQGWRGDRGLALLMAEVEAR